MAKLQHPRHPIGASQGSRPSGPHPHLRLVYDASRDPLRPEYQGSFPHSGPQEAGRSAGPQPVRPPKVGRTRFGSGERLLVTDLAGTSAVQAADPTVDEPAPTDSPLWPADKELVIKPNANRPTLIGSQELMRQVDLFGNFGASNLSPSDLHAPDLVRCAIFSTSDGSTQVLEVYDARVTPERVRPWTPRENLRDISDWVQAGWYFSLRRTPSGVVTGRFIDKSHLDSWAHVCTEKPVKELPSEPPSLRAQVLAGIRRVAGALDQQAPGLEGFIAAIRSCYHVDDDLA